jgi:hypothetical protein
MQPEPLEKMSDLRLAEVMNITWSQIMQLNNQLTGIQSEIEKRKFKPIKKDDKVKK